MFDGLLNWLLGAGRAVGVDIEKIRTPRLRVAGRFFPPDELEDMRERPARRVWKLWTRREAVFKQGGSGKILNSYQVSGYALSVCGSLCEPELLSADEPTTALDVTIQAQILDLIYRMREQFNISVLLITHDLGVVAEAADRVAVMYCGRIVEEGSTREILTAPRHPYTLGLLKSIPRLDDIAHRLYMIPGMVPPPEEIPPYCAFADRCDRCTDECRADLPPLTVDGTRKIRCLHACEK